MRMIWVIGVNTFREIIRDRILYSLILFALLIMGLSVALGQLSFAEQTRISMNFGFSAISLSTVVLSIFVGAMLVSKEIEKRTVLTLLARPISRSQFLVGKYFGMSLVIATILVGLGLVLALVLAGYGVKWNKDCTVAMFGILYEAEILLGVTMLFGSISRPTLTVTFAAGIYLIGHWLDSMAYFAEHGQSKSFKTLSDICEYIIPNLERFNWRQFAVTDKSLALKIFLNSSIHSVFWIILLLSLASLVFRRRDFV